MRREVSHKQQVHHTRRTNSVVRERNSRRQRPQSRRALNGVINTQDPFSPPEDWHEPLGNRAGYKVITRSPGAGYRHVVTPGDVRERLSQLPQHFLEDLEVVQLSGMTRKKQSFPCYGMQWGSTLYLYPLEESLREFFGSPPPTAFYNEAKMFGGRWRDMGQGEWMLEWTEPAIRDFYLNNILIHELGHLLDERNSNYTDRERYAEWFAMQFGYRSTGGIDQRRPGRKVRRRHHSC
jgi:hypothetical protein